MSRFSGAALSIANRRKPRRRDRLVELHLTRAPRLPATHPQPEPVPLQPDAHRASARLEVDGERRRERGGASAGVTSPRRGPQTAPEPVNRAPAGPCSRVSRTDRPSFASNPPWARGDLNPHEVSLTGT